MPNARSAVVVTGSVMRDDRRLKAMLHAKSVKTADKTKFLEVCASFMELAEQIASEINDSSFRGEYSKLCTIQNPYTQFIDCEKGVANVIEFEMKIRKLLALDQECKYQGSKLGYTGDEWFLECWRNKKKKK